VNISDGETQLAFKVGNVSKLPFFDHLLQGKIIGVPAPVLESVENNALCFGKLFQVLRLGVCSGNGLIHEDYVRTPRLLEEKSVCRRYPPCFPASSARCRHNEIISHQENRG